ncbi:MAG TPA: DUF1501 domain-containing protein, partial [Pirellulaceae bacterium]|nr:DUF1501 domain-containing protein [Pirellulaceae bacterium]
MRAPMASNATTELTRRSWLGTTLGLASGGFASLAWSALAAGADPADQAGTSTTQSKRESPSASHPTLKARAKRVIFLCMRGGPSHMETFDPKPKLT